MNVVFLEKLIKILEKIPNEKFDINTWQMRSVGCNTVCCAAGWAALDPEFIDAGFKMSEDYFGSVMPSYKGMLPYESLQEFFGLGPDQVWWIFYRHSYKNSPNPKDVIEHIKNVLNGEEIRKREK